MTSPSNATPGSHPSVEQISTAKTFDGQQAIIRHASRVLGCDMTFGIFLPAAATTRKLPVLYWLSGLTCTEQNFVTKAGAAAYAAKHEVILVAPDTSPRGEGVADDPAYDLGMGAGFYVNATQEPWAKHYRMYDYVVSELPAIVEANFPARSEKSIFGHSMGGHGALTIALKNPGKYRSVSAFSPIVAPSQCPWGEKAFSAYLGPSRADWLAHDTTALIESASERLPLLIDQGTADNFLEPQLKPHLLKTACERAGHPLELRMQEGYDHSYYFIATFMEDHVAHHARALKG